MGERQNPTYIERPIPTTAAPPHDLGHDKTRRKTRVTPAPHGRSLGGENPADLLWSAQHLSDSADAIGAAAASPGAAAAIAAALGHIETALENLERGTEEMERLARARLTPATVLLGDLGMTWSSPRRHAISKSSYVRSRTRVAPARRCATTRGRFSLSSAV
jgi:hypothetical protein